MATGVDGDGDGRAPRRTRLPAAERRETILSAAAEVFAEAGYRAAKVSDVAERVGVTEPVIFQNFGSKAGLFAAVVERAGAEVRASLDDLAAGFGSASGLLAHVLAGSAHEQPGQGRHARGAGHSAAGHAGDEHAGAEHAAAAYGVLFADATALAAEPALSGPVRDVIRAVAAHLANLIRRAQADGEISSGTDPEAAAWLLLSVLSARRLRAAAMPDNLEPAVAALTLRAITSPLNRAASCTTHSDRRRLAEP
jgi:AcrR family transcriptional regulator